MNRISKILIGISMFVSLMFFCNSEVHAQGPGTLRGIVTDSSTAEVLAYVNVYVKEIGSGASTDLKGYFTITGLAPGNYTLVVSYIGYQSKVIQATVQSNKVTRVDVQLSQGSVVLQTIEKVGESTVAPNATEISIQRFTIKELESMPQGVETDVLRSLQYLPGVQTTSDVSAKYYVRGGASNQNLVMLDGITIYSPFHALGLFSVIDPDIINNVEFYKGGFSAEYGGRLSSVLNVITKDGNKNKYGAKLSSSYLSGKALVEGPIPHGSFFVGGRKSYSNAILKKFLNDKNVPSDFYDLSFKLNYSNPDFVEGAKFSVNGFFSQDNITNGNPLIEDYKWKNDVFGFDWFQVGDSPLFYELGFSVSKFSGEVMPKQSGSPADKNEVTDFGLKMNFTYITDSKDEFNLGFHIKQIRTELALTRVNGVTTKSDVSGANIVAYGKYKFLRYENFGLDVGTRVNLTRLANSSGGVSILEPRVNITTRLTPTIALKGAWGIYQQEMTTLSDENEVINVFEPWIIIPTYLKPAVGTHYIGGIQADITSTLSLSIEGYYKTTKNVPYLNESKILITDPDFITGEAESYGSEYTLRFHPSQMNITASYALAWAYKIIDGKRYYPRYDSRNNVNLSLTYDFGSGWEASAVWSYASGLPFTKVIGYYDKYYFDQFFTPWNQYDPTKPYALLDVQNLGRLPDYHRLDLTISKKFRFGFMNLEFEGSIINVYDRKNIFYFKRDTGERVNMLPFLPTATVKAEI